MNLRTFACAASLLVLIKSVEAAFPPRVPHPRGEAWSNATSPSDLIAGYKTEMAAIYKEISANNPQCDSTAKVQRYNEILTVLRSDSGEFNESANGQANPDVNSPENPAQQAVPERQKKPLTFSTVDDPDVDFTEEQIRNMQNTRETMQNRPEVHTITDSGSTSSVTKPSGLKILSKIIIAGCVIAVVIVVCLAIYFSRLKSSSS